MFNFFNCYYYYNFFFLYIKQSIYSKGHNMEFSEIASN